jgi:hypothetical protein
MRHQIASTGVNRAAMDCRFNALKTHQTIEIKEFSEIGTELALPPATRRSSARGRAA